MPKAPLIAYLLLLTAPLCAQEKRLWVLRAPGEMVEYDLQTFAVKQTVKVPADALKNPAAIEVNHLGQILFVTPAPLPLAEEDVASAHKVWFWNGSGATMIDLGLKREVTATGSNQAVTESSPTPFLSADGAHLFWFANAALLDVPLRPHTQNLCNCYETAPDRIGDFAKNIELILFVGGVSDSHGHGVCVSSQPREFQFR